MTTADWIAWADTHALPEEDIKVASGGTQGWPSGMLGEVSARNLHSMHITKVSVICQDALAMNKEQFEAKYGKAWAKIHAVHEYFARAVQNPERLAELKRRLTPAAPPPNTVPTCPSGHLCVGTTGVSYSFFLGLIHNRGHCNECRVVPKNDDPQVVMRCGACMYDCCAACAKKKGWK